jgi:hypothetical protein
MKSATGRAIGSVVAGQLVTNAGLTIPQTFNTVGAFTIVSGTFGYIFYQIVR